MSSYTLPLSSSTPTTPEHRGNSHKYSNGGRIFGTNISNTPAGPPPSLKSFTPAGPPPSSTFANSEPDTNHPFFNVLKSGFQGSSSQKQNYTTSQHSHPRNERQRFKPSNNSRNRIPKNHTFVSSPPSGPSSDDEESVESEYYDRGENGYEDGDHSEESEQDSMAVDSDAENRQPTSTDDARMGSSVMSDRFHQGNGSIFRKGTPRGSSKSHGYRAEKPRSFKKDSVIPVIAKNMASQLGIPSIDESEDLIMGTEALVSQIYDLSEGQESALESTLSNVSEKLTDLWNRSVEGSAGSSSLTGDYARIGPDERAPSFHRAVYLATLLLKLRHPPPAKGKQAFATSRSTRPLKSSTLSQNPTALPKVLIDWLDEQYSPYKAATLSLLTHEPNPTAHSNYWDILFSSVIRGRIALVVKILQKSDFKEAYTAREDGLGESGYQGVLLENIRMVIDRAIRVLELCPALRDENWNVPGFEWILFRKHVEQCMDDLTTFAEGRNRDLDPGQSTFQAPNFSVKIHSTTLSETTRRAESKVPWTVYQNLKALYNLLLGQDTEIISLSQDWIEASTALTIWWAGNDDDDDFAGGSLSMSRRSIRRSQSRNTRLVDINPQVAYLRRLAFAFDRVTNSSENVIFEVSPVDPVEVGLASIFEGNLEGVILLLEGWSLLVAAAVIEVASKGGWYDESSNGGAMNDFDESDLMVLSSYGQESRTSKKDSILIKYAEALSKKGVLRQGHQESTEGWELSIALFSRLDDNRTTKKKFSELLQRIPLISDFRTDKLLGVCRSADMDQEARTIAENYGDSVAEESDRYGTALIYYARAHNIRKVKDVLDLLISLSLVQSIAFPPVAALDHNLRAFLLHPKETLKQLAEFDREASDILHVYLTGYASLRKFYDLRDEEVNLKEGEKPSLRPFARKKAASTALLAVINSAADNIHGGLYDPESEAIVQVDGLLTLLGEALPFVNQQDSILSISQCFALVKAIEDLETVNPRVCAQCEECFRSTLAAAHGAQQPPPPRDLLRKTISNMTSSSSFSLVGSCMLGSDSSSLGGAATTNGSAGSSGFLVKVPVPNIIENVASGTEGVDGAKRGWDWRMAVKRDSTGKGLLRSLRLGLARDISKLWLEDVVRY